MRRTQPSSETLYREWAPKLEARKGLMLPLSAFPEILKKHDPGYASVYMFTKEAADEIKAARSSRDFKQYEVIADEIIIDLDGGEPQLGRCRIPLQGIGYEVWASGGKGFHVRIPTGRLVGNDVPDAHRQWVDSLGVDADLSLYRASSVVSLPGRVHPKTRIKKTFVEWVDGAMPHIPDPVIVERPAFPSADIPELASLLSRLANLTALEPSPGNRHTAVWSAAMSLRDAGLSEDATIELLTMVNSAWLNPKPDDEVRRAAEQAFRR